MPSREEIAEMIRETGLDSLDSLFSEIPTDLRKRSLDLPEHVTEYGLIRKASQIADENKWGEFTNFMGCGSYDRIIPASVDHIISRSEFITSYTPYQPEVSQGLLQALFEYQSTICDLTEMDVTNSSMYDGVTALAEAVRMSYRVNGRKKILLPETIYDSRTAVINSYVEGLPVSIEKYRIDRKTGFIDLEDLASRVDGDTSCIVVENPNGLGVLDPNVTKVHEIKGESNLISYSDPVSLGAVLPPGRYGADISVMEGQPLGIHQNFGGPYLGIMSFRKELVRKSPGRIIGETVDVNGKRAFVMTLQTREQHIRREKAMSNICSNQALMALASLAYISILGPSGLRKAALMTIKKSGDLRNHLQKIRKDSVPVSGTLFSDVPVTIRKPESLKPALMKNRIMGGIPLADLSRSLSGEFRNTFFFSVTEKTEDSDIEKLSKVLEVVL
ncbi:MAG: aminomethyl-transferring glycine dehydrogenase subunit GcvPA [Thermoplasmataceae archaeon]